MPVLLPPPPPQPQPVPQGPLRATARGTVAEPTSGTMGCRLATVGTPTTALPSHKHPLPAPPEAGLRPLLEARVIQKGRWRPAVSQPKGRAGEGVPLSGALASPAWSPPPLPPEEGHRPTEACARCTPRCPRAQATRCCSLRRLRGGAGARSAMPTAATATPRHTCRAARRVPTCPGALALAHTQGQQGDCTRTRRRPGRAARSLGCVDAREGDGASTDGEGEGVHASGVARPLPVTPQAATAWSCDTMPTRDSPPAPGPEGRAAFATAPLPLLTPAPHGALDPGGGAPTAAAPGVPTDGRGAGAPRGTPTPRPWPRPWPRPRPTSWSLS